MAGGGLMIDKWIKKAKTMPLEEVIQIYVDEFIEYTNVYSPGTEAYFTEQLNDFAKIVKG
jgi:hypothetical protein